MKKHEFHTSYADHEDMHNRSGKLRSFKKITFALAAGGLLIVLALVLLGLRT
jgi:hypothetical protein